MKVYIETDKGTPEAHALGIEIRDGATDDDVRRAFADAAEALLHHRRTRAVQPALPAVKVVC